MSMLLKATTGIGCTIVALPLLATVLVAALLDSVVPGSGTFTATPGKNALADVPPAMLDLYQRAAPECPGLSWTILAAIGKAETDHGRHPTMKSPAGAVGPMQFLPSTFRAYAHPVPPGGKRPPTPWDPVDAVFAAARLLCAHGARHSQNLKRAIYAYNHSHAYVASILRIARRYAAASPATSREPATGSARATAAVAFARRQIGTPYVWGGDGPSEGGFDCSGLTKAAYASIGITLPRVAQDQYDAGPRLAAPERLLPGDLLFFGTSPQAITHVGIYAGHHRMIDAPRPGAVVREARVRLTGAAYQGAARPHLRGAR
ncbi:bifunctional lytic transglycosylase/C40 family peptidase [Streptomyces luomodiensis]|uniref:Bifunctional lytic transglycosylase/C40 family peptidase n=1 Tax=Streptomyces luomodiensis TaxID=3026192 RepID=A0ABY9USI6_9ACTN|nr:bifunctional lytic transglycosylase/C40 family peptidase [Streptomyces sp. SCA4-21]WNE95522.1 bifunctional lytic transglycosylase/C40 family peptidase [Streptomyces sp. SCA4-21]